MKNISDFEKIFKNKTNVSLVLDYNGTIAPTEPTINSPLSNIRFKRILENFSKKSFVKIMIITNRSIKEFKDEFGIDFKEIEVYGAVNKTFQNDEGKVFAKKEDILVDINDNNKSDNVIYIGDDKSLIKKVKAIGGNAIGILPLCDKGTKLVDFPVSQNKFEESLITINNLYL